MKLAAWILAVIVMTGAACGRRAADYSPFAVSEPLRAVVAGGDGSTYMVRVVYLFRTREDAEAFRDLWRGGGE